GFQTVLLETRHVKAALSAMTVKTDRKDACGLAQLLRMGCFQPVHAKSIGLQEIRALLVARKQLLGRLLDVELSIRGILRGFGLKVGQVTRKTFEARIWELVTGHATLERIAEAMLSARATLQAQYAKLHKAVLAIVREDAVCRRLITVPGVGPGRSHALGDDARNRIHLSAGGYRNDHRDGMARVSVRPRGARRGRQRGGSGGQTQKSAPRKCHGMPPLVGLRMGTRIAGFVTAAAAAG